MFFRKKAKANEEDAGVETSGTASLDAEASPVEGTMPELAEVAPTPEAGVPALDAGLEGAAPVVASDAIRLFPGFEREDFEVGFSAGPVPALVMRWKDGGDWFRMPPMFNRAVLSSMDERDSAGDLSRLLRSFGYDVEPA